MLQQRIHDIKETSDLPEEGRVLSVSDGIVRAHGLTNIQAEELVEFASGVKGMCMNLEAARVGIVLLVRIASSNRARLSSELVRLSIFLLALRC
jgi:F0F1-type ATP synthase alpha subunit